MMAKRTTKGSVKKKSTTKKSTPRKTGAQAAKQPTKKRGATTGKRKTSALDAAVRVLTESKQPMSTKEMITAMAEKGYWTSPGGKTPHGTLYSAILREQNAKGKESRFVKVERGKFTARG